MRRVDVISESQRGNGFFVPTKIVDDERQKTLDGYNQDDPKAVAMHIYQDPNMNPLATGRISPSNELTVMDLHSAEQRNRVMSPVQFEVVEKTVEEKSRREKKEKKRRITTESKKKKRPIRRKDVEKEFPKAPGMAFFDEANPEDKPDFCAILLEEIETDKNAWFRILRYLVEAFVHKEWIQWIVKMQYKFHSVPIFGRSERKFCEDLLAGKQICFLDDYYHHPYEAILQGYYESSVYTSCLLRETEYRYDPLHTGTLVLFENTKRVNDLPDSLTVDGLECMLIDYLAAVDAAMIETDSSNAWPWTTVCFEWFSRIEPSKNFGDVFLNSCLREMVYHCNKQITKQLLLSKLRFSSEEEEEEDKNYDLLDLATKNQNMPLANYLLSEEVGMDPLRQDSDEETCFYKWCSSITKYTEDLIDLVPVFEFTTPNKIRLILKGYRNEAVSVFFKIFERCKTEKTARVNTIVDKAIPKASYQQWLLYIIHELGALRAAKGTDVLYTGELFSDDEGDDDDKGEMFGEENDYEKKQEESEDSSSLHSCTEKSIQSPISDVEISLHHHEQCRAADVVEIEEEKILPSSPLSEAHSINALVISDKKQSN